MKTIEITLNPAELDALIAVVVGRRNLLDQRAGMRSRPKALRTVDREELTFLTALQAKLTAQATAVPVAVPAPKTVLGVRETSAGVYRVTFDGAVRGDSRGYDYRGAVEEARRLVAIDPDCRILAEPLRVPATADAVTDLEAQVLLQLARNLFTSINGGEPTRYQDCSDQLWSDCLDQHSGGDPANTITGRRLSAICGTLAQKGMLVRGSSGRDAWTSITQLGFDAYVAAREAGRYGSADLKRALDAVENHR